jgi:hypothetical protein
MEFLKPGHHNVNGNLKRLKTGPFRGGETIPANLKHMKYENQ